MSQAAPPAEREMLRALSGEPLALAVTMHQRDRMIDLVLIDIEQPVRWAEHLQRIPSLVVIAPPDGDLARLSPRVRVEIDLLLDTVTPSSVLGVGDASLEDYFRAFAALRRSGALAGCLPGRLHTTANGLRSVLIKGLRVWATTAGRGSWIRPECSP
jgi:hypothetical protein